MNIPAALNHLLEGQDLSSEAMRAIMRAIMSGRATPAQIGGFLMALRAKGESISEVVAAAEVLREMCTRVEVQVEHLIDTCGTGGDGAHTFNISTASAFVAAAAGCRVAKHGNRSVSSKSGSADVLEAAGVNLNLTPEQVKACIEQVGLGFLFAQRHHGAMQHAIGPRRELGVRTIFNLLGPLTNPAGAPHQLIGVYSAAWVEPLAAALHELGSRHVLVVHAEDGLDEISIGAPTRVAELRDSRIEVYTLTPERFGLSRAPLSWLAVATAEDSLRMMQGVFEGEPGPARDIVLVNAGAAIYAAGLAETLEIGVVRAAEAIDSGAARNKLDELVAFSQRFAG
jgi:anthranilate phosphoribosyltransferase